MKSASILTGVKTTELAHYRQQDREDMAKILHRHGIRVTPRKVTEMLDLLLRSGGIYDLLPDSLKDNDG